MIVPLPARMLPSALVQLLQQVVLSHRHAWRGRRFKRSPGRAQAVDKMQSKPAGNCGVRAVLTGLSALHGAPPTTDRSCISEEIPARTAEECNPPWRAQATVEERWAGREQRVALAAGRYRNVR